MLYVCDFWVDGVVESENVSVSRHRIVKAVFKCMQDFVL